MSRKPVAGALVLVLRPQPAADALCRLMRADGIAALPLPPFEFVAVMGAAREAMIQSWQQLSADTEIIFTSPQAVHQVGLLGALPSKRLFAVGHATAALVAARFATPAQAPRSGRGARRLFKEYFQDRRGKVAIVSGADSPIPLGDWLAEIGWCVQRIEPYHRQPLAWNTAVSEALPTATRVVCALTSTAALAVLDSAPNDARRWLRAATLIVPSERVAVAARQRGYHHLRQSAPDNERLHRTIVALLADR